MQLVIALRGLADEIGVLFLDPGDAGQIDVRRIFGDQASDPLSKTRELFFAQASFATSARVNRSVDGDVKAFSHLNLLHPFFVRFVVGVRGGEDDLSKTRSWECVPDGSRACFIT